jgi:hypothetical protein
MSINTSNRNEQKQSGNFESMFLLDEFKKEGTKPPRDSINPKNNSSIIKDSLDVSNSIVKPHLVNNNNNQESLIIDEDQAWKNEMMNYEKYLKDDLETYGKQLNEFDNVNASKAFSTKSSIQSNLNKNICNEESKEKIEKLKISVDHLRREFQTDVHKMDAKFSADNKNNNNIIVLNDIKRKISARKIQRWYRRHHLRIKAGEAALKRQVFFF